jgi:hypothetical protein
VPFNSTSFPIVLVAEAVGLPGGAPPKTDELGAAAQTNMPASKSRQEKYRRRTSVAGLSTIPLRSIISALESVLKMFTSVEIQARSSYFQRRAAAL